MPAPKAPPKQAPALENYYTVSEAAVRLGLRPKDEDSKKGEKWLRDGVNRPEDGSEGVPFPCHRMAGQLMFSDSDLAEIAAMHRNAPQRRGRTRRKRSTQTAAPKTSKSSASKPATTSAKPTSALAPAA